MIKAHKVKSFGGTGTKDGYKNYIQAGDTRIYVNDKQYVDINIYDVVCFYIDENGEAKLTKVFKDISHSADLKYKELKKSKTKFKAFEIE